MRTKLGKMNIWRRRKPPIRTGAGILILAAASAVGVAAIAPAATAQPAPAQASAAQGKAGNSAPLSITKQYFGSTTEPYTGKVTPTYRYTLSNGRGMTVQLLSYGAITQAVNVPGKNGKTADVVLGFKTLQDYVANDSPPVTANGGPYFGETVGRYANANRYSPTDRRRSRCRWPMASRSRARRSTSARRTPSARGSAT